MTAINHENTKLFVVTGKDGVSSYCWLPQRTQQTRWRRKVTPERMRAEIILSLDQNGIRNFLDAPSDYVGSFFFYPAGRNPSENMLIESIVSRVHGFLDMAHAVVEERSFHAHAGALVQ